MARVKRSQSELRLELSEQILALRASCKAYDTGEFWEAKRIASCIYILFNDGGNNRSLLQQLGIKGKIPLLSTSVKPSALAKRLGVIPNFRTANRLVAAVIDPLNPRYVPKFGAIPADHTWMKFDPWWEEIAFGGVGNPVLTRKNLIFGLRNQDGGAHVDSALEGYYHTVKHRGDAQVTVGSGNDKGRHLANALSATSRQIGWEVDQSLITYGL